LKAGIAASWAPAALKVAIAQIAMYDLAAGFSRQLSRRAD